MKPTKILFATCLRPRLSACNASSGATAAAGAAETIEAAVGGGASRADSGNREAPSIAETWGIEAAGNRGRLIAAPHGSQVRGGSRRATREAPTPIRNNGYRVYSNRGAYYYGGVTGRLPARAGAFTVPTTVYPHVSVGFASGRLSIRLYGVLQSVRFGVRICGAAHHPARLQYPASSGYRGPASRRCSSPDIIGQQGPQNSLAFSWPGQRPHGRPSQIAEHGAVVRGRHSGRHRRAVHRRRRSALAGRHHIEVRASGYQTMSFDVDIIAGQVIPYQGTMER